MFLYSYSMPILPIVWKMFVDLKDTCAENLPYRARGIPAHSPPLRRRMRIAHSTLARLLQKIYFSANCITRGGRDARICPNSELVMSLLGFTGRKLVVTL